MVPIRVICWYRDWTGGWMMVARRCAVPSIMPYSVTSVTDGIWPTLAEFFTLSRVNLRAILIS